MPESGIPESVRRFVAAHINSIAELEVLLFLQTKAHREWSALEVSSELRSSVMSTQDHLGDLAAKGFLAVRETDAVLLYRYAPATEEVARLIDDLGFAYKERRLRVINLIYARPESDTVVFSEAFNIPKKKGEE